MDLSIIISLISLIGTVFIYLFHDKKLKDQEKRLNEFELEKHETERVEKQKAFVKAKVSKQNSNTRLEIYNDGQSKAKDVNIIYDQQNDIYIFFNDLIPYEFLNPNERFFVPIIFSESSL